MGGPTAILQDALLSELRGAPCRLGARIASLEQKSGCVSVCFNDGRSENYDLVIGADGIGSSVRSLAVSECAPSYIPGKWCGAVWRRSAGTPRTKCNSGLE